MVLKSVTDIRFTIFGISVISNWLRKVGIVPVARKALTEVTMSGSTELQFF